MVADRDRADDALSDIVLWRPLPVAASCQFVSFLLVTVTFVSPELIA